MISFKDKVKDYYIYIKKYYLLIIIIIIAFIELIIYNKINLSERISKIKNLLFGENQIININASSSDNITLYKIKGINYLNKCKKELLTYRKKILPINYIPKISVIIPVYNCENTIVFSLRSIQNQNFLDFEIILVNDFSSDNSLQIIEKIQKEDNRIKILNNKRNMGTLFSRCIGTLKSKGKYIFALDNDDLFLTENLFENIYRVAELNYYDIIEFKSFSILNYNPNISDIEDSYFNHHQDNLILHQPELGLFPISNNNKYTSNDFWIWAKCIKSKIYKKSINALGKKRYSIYNCWTEDISIIFIIFNIAQSYIFLNIYGIFHYISITTASNTLNISHKLFSQIFLLDIIIDFSKKNKENKKYAVYKALEISKNDFSLLNLKDQIYLKKILIKLINSKYIDRHDKLLIKNLFKINLIVS